MNYLFGSRRCHLHLHLCLSLPLLATTACGNDQDRSGDEGVAGDGWDGSSGAGEGEGDGSWTGDGTSGGDDWPDTSGEPTGDGDGDGDGWDGGDGSDGGDGDGGDGTGGDGTGGDGIEPGQLTAGEWRDLSHWDFWRGLFENIDSEWTDMESSWGLSTAGRYPVVVMSDSLPVVDANVVLRGPTNEIVWRGRTDANGEAELFSGLFLDSDGNPIVMYNEEDLAIEVSSGDDTVILENPSLAGTDPNVIIVPDATAPTEVLDLMFVVDTTGSMGDELHYLQAELADVISQVDANSDPDLSIRVSVNFYRDYGDTYVVRDFPFTTPEVAMGQLAQQTYGGGGDFPEALDLALHNGVVEHDWSESAVSRLLFLVADAPPHIDEAIPTIQASVEAAAQRGIRIMPVAASGVDKSTEFLMRMTDVATGGTYIFLTNDSGIGNGHIEPTIGEFQVELLNELLIRVISESLG